MTVENRPSPVASASWRDRVRRIVRSSVLNLSLLIATLAVLALLLDRLRTKILPGVVVLIFRTTNDRDDNSTNIRHGGYHKPYLVQTATGDWHFLGQPVPRSRHSYMLENPVVRHSWLVRLAVTA